MGILDFGLDGENIVRSELKKLPASYVSIFDFKNGKGGNVDAVVLGPTGIWIIEVKNTHKKVISRDRTLEKYVNQAYRNKKRVEEFLMGKGMQKKGQAILVFANRKTSVRFGKTPIKGVLVIGISWLNEVIQDQTLNYPLSEEECVQIHDAVKKYTSIL